MDKNLRKIKTALKKYNAKILEVENDLKDKISFKFKIEADSGDGIVVLDLENSNHALLYDCLEVIKKKGMMTLNDFNCINF